MPSIETDANELGRPVYEGWRPTTITEQSNVNWASTLRLMPWALLWHWHTCIFLVKVKCIPILPLIIRTCICVCLICLIPFIRVNAWSCMGCMKTTWFWCDWKSWHCLEIHVMKIPWKVWLWVPL